MKNLVLILILVQCTAKQSFSQKQVNEKSDSLFSVLLTSKEDTSKLNTLNSLVRELRYSNHDTAYYFAKEALALAEKLNHEMKIADSKVTIGALLADMGRCDEGVKNATDALDIYKNLYQTSPEADKKILLRKLGRSYGIIGHNRIAQGNYPEGLKNTLLALKIVEELGDKEGIATYEWNLSNIYVTQHNYPEALKHLSVCLKLSLESGIKNDIAQTYDAIGFVYIEQRKYDEALKYYSTALKLAEEGQDAYTLAETYINLGTIKEKQGNLSEALKYNFAALSRYLEIGFHQQVSLAYNQIGSIYNRQKKYPEASEYFTKGLAQAKESNNLEYTKLTYENWALLDSAQGNYKKSLEHYKLAIAYRDSLQNEGNTKKMVQQQMQYDFDKKEATTKSEQEKKDAITLKELQKQKLMRNGFVGGFSVVLLFAGVFFTQRNKIKKGKKRSDELLLNILPEEVAEELKAKGSAEAKQFNDVTVMFTDFKNFTRISEKLSPAELVSEIHSCFKAFDDIITKNNIEKIKTIGDSYMCAGGLPVANKTNATDVVSAALEIQQFMRQHLQQRKNEDKEPFEIRIGVHTGPVVAGIVGVKKFAYDIWGDTVNIASRMESSSEAGKINISGSTYELVKDKFKCDHRGKIQAKNKGEIDMYFVEQSFSDRVPP